MTKPTVGKPFDTHDLAVAQREFYQDRHYKDLRFGQFVCNRFDITWRELFYCEDNKAAYSLATELTTD